MVCLCHNTQRAKNENVGYLSAHGRGVFVSQHSKGEKLKCRLLIRSQLWCVGVQCSEECWHDNDVQ